MRFENTIIIDKPPKEVFAYLANLERIPDWNYAIRSTRQTTEGPVQVGMRYIQERTLPSHMIEELEITGYQQDVLLEVAGGFGPFPSGRSTYRLEPISERKTILRNEVELEADSLLRLAFPLVNARIRTAVRQNLEVLKKFIEA